MISKESKDVLPLVSILIPTYNQTKFLKLAIDSALNQTYKNTEIVICDDSTTNDVQELVEEYMKITDKIRYYNNGGPLGKNGGLNVEKCFEMSRGEYISFLFHDDEYYPLKIEKMMGVFLTKEYVSLVSSTRNCIDENGCDVNFDEFKCYSNMDISGVEAARNILFSFYNFIGEFTTVMFKKNDVISLGGNINTYFKSDMKCLTDISLFLKLCSKGNVFFFKEPLSKFRLHAQSNTFDKSILYLCCVDFMNIILDSYECGIYIYNTEELNILFSKWKSVYGAILGSAMNMLKYSKDYTGEYQRFINRLEKYNIKL